MTIDRTGVRQAFLDRRPFALDAFQVEAMDAIDAGSSVLVAAPTGSGKTLVAEYAVAVALAEGTKVFYTTPLKALSNQKYHDLVRAHGAENVGLLTGDNAINGDAAAVVMTTEVLRNMIYANSPALQRLGFVVLDEVHYLQNAYRGPVWEEVIIHAPPEVSLVCLSATVSNAEELTEWIETVRGATVPIIEERRPVTLTHHYLVAETYTDALHMLPTFTPSGRPNQQAPSYDARSGAKPWKRHGPQQGRHRTPSRGEVVEHLRSEAMLPAICFIFSRNACDQAVRQCVNEGVHLTAPAERARIREIAEAKVQHLSDDDLRVLGYGEWLAALEDGIAAHHAGMVPTFKEVVEECFAEALVKVVFATETLALGINMPARTVVIEKLSKFTGERHEFLTPGEYTQLTGRAGRRGIDDVGNAVVLWSPWVAFEQVASLASTRTYTLVSSFRPTYNMAANLVRRYPPDVAHHLLNLSFAQFRADADVVRLETQLERASERIDLAQRRAHCERGDVRAWDARRAGTSPETRHDTPEFIAKAITHLKIGDVIQDPGTDLTRHVVVISTSQRRGHDTKLGVLTRDGRRFTLIARDFTVAPHRVRHIDLPRPYSPSNKDFVRRAASSLREQVSDEKDEFVPRGYENRSGVAGCPDLEAHLKAIADVDRLTRERDRLERRVKGRSESLARQFDRVLDLLRGRGYVEQWSLTAAGESLSKLYHEADLLIVECLRRGVLDDLDAASLAALVSTFTYERRGPAGTGPEPYFHTEAVQRGWVAIEAIWQDLAGSEQELGLPLTKAPDPGFCAFAYAWVAGDELSHILEEEELSGGDFVRNVKQLLDLLGQVAEVTRSLETAATARAASEELFRGIVASSSLTEPATTTATVVSDEEN
jgi:ATP-dependent RNA helicase HelY